MTWGQFIRWVDPQVEENHYHLHVGDWPDPGYDGNGNGAPAAATIADLDGDGQLEILVQTFDHGLDIFTVPGSGGNCRLWTTARGGPLRMGRSGASD